MSNGNLTRAGLLAETNVAGPRYRFTPGSLANRQTRFATRTAMRYGDWGILDFPRELLWFDELELAAADDELDALAPAIIDIWG